MRDVDARNSGEIFDGLSGMRAEEWMVFMMVKKKAGEKKGADE